MTATRAPARSGAETRWVYRQCQSQKLTRCISLSIYSSFPKEAGPRRRQQYWMERRQKYNIIFKVYVKFISMVPIAIIVPAPGTKVTRSCFYDAKQQPDIDE